MEDYYYGRNHVPAFGSWGWDNDLSFTQCFETASRGRGLFPYTYKEDRDLYVAGDLYENHHHHHVVAPAMIVVPRRRLRKKCLKEEQIKKQSWEMKESPSPPMHRPTPKPVDEDLYKISPDLLYAKPKKKRGLGFFSSCLIPTCGV